MLKLLALIQWKSTIFVSDSGTLFVQRCANNQFRPIYSVLNVFQKSPIFTSNHDFLSNHDFYPDHDFCGGIGQKIVIGPLPSLSPKGSNPAI